MKSLNHIKHENKNNLILILILIILIVDIGAMSSHTVYANLGIKGIDATYFLFLILFLLKVYKKQLDLQSSKTIFILISLYALTHIYSFWTNNSGSLDQLSPMLLFLIVVVILYTIKWEKYLIVILASGLSIIFILIFKSWFEEGLITDSFSSFFKHSNTLAIILYISSFFTLLASIYTKTYLRAYFVVITLLSVLVIYSTSSRAVLLTIFIALLSFFIYKFRPNWFKYSFIIVVLFNIVLMFLYVSVSNTKMAKPINEISMSLFDKPIFRNAGGRSDIWNTLINEGFVNSPFLGFGYNVHPSDFGYTFSFTSHNVYIQILLEVGIIGFIIFFMILYYTWALLMRNLNNVTTVLSACFFISMLLYLNFELTFMPNSISFVPIAILQWLGITLGIKFRDKQKIQT